MAKIDDLLPTPLGRYEAMRLTPPKTVEFWGYVYGESGPEKPCDVFTRDQVVALIRKVLEMEPSARMIDAGSDALGMIDPGLHSAFNAMRQQQIKELCDE